MEIEKYKKLKNQLVLFFQNYVDNHTLKDCIEYYYFLEDCSEEDTLLFSVPMIEKYIDDFDNNIYDHIGCMVYHSGNFSMLCTLLKAHMTTKNDYAKEYYQYLIDSTVEGLQKTARSGFQYSGDYLNAVRKHIDKSMK